MTKDDILTAAREAGFEVVDGQLRLYFDGSKALLKPNYMGTVVDGLKEFAAPVAAREREACAKVCDEWYEKRGLYEVDFLAKAIRARGEK